MVKYRRLRNCIVDILSNSDRPLTASEICEKLREMYPRSKVTFSSARVSQLLRDMPGVKSEFKYTYCGINRGHVKVYWVEDEEEEV